MSDVLSPIVPEIWHRPQRHRYLGLQLGTRMTIVRLPSGGLWVHSPIRLDEELRAAVDALGPVQHLVCPNLYHHVYAGDWAQAYPAARVHAPARLGKKRKDLRLDAPLSSLADADWGGALLPVPILGTMLDETVFVHAPTKTLISADLTENFVHGTDSALTNLYLRASGIYKKPGWSRLMRVAYRDRRAALECIEGLLAHDFDRVVVAHGEIIETGGKAALRDTFRFLGTLSG